MPDLKSFQIRVIRVNPRLIIACQASLKDKKGGIKAAPFGTARFEIIYELRSDRFLNCATSFLRA
jgi:hypothetical protein